MATPREEFSDEELINGCSFVLVIRRALITGLEEDSETNEEIHILERISCYDINLQVMGNEETDGLKRLLAFKKHRAANLPLSQQPGLKGKGFYQGGSVEEPGKLHHTQINPQIELKPMGTT